MNMRRKAIIRAALYTVLMGATFLPWCDWGIPLSLFPFPAKLVGWQSMWVGWVRIASGRILGAATLGVMLYYLLGWLGDCAPVVGILGFAVMAWPEVKWLKRTYSVASVVSLIGLVCYVLYSATRDWGLPAPLWGLWLSLCLLFVIVGMEVKSFIDKRVRR